MVGQLMHIFGVQKPNRQNCGRREVRQEAVQIKEKVRLTE